MEAHGRKRRKTKVQLCESGFQQVERYAGRTALNYTHTRCLAACRRSVCVLINIVGLIGISTAAIDVTTGKIYD